MRRFLLYFSYIGTGFRGVQRLIPRHVKTNLITPAVTEVIEDALKRRLLLEKLPILHTASRTDAGVHALRSAASVDLDVPNLPPDAITVTLNHYFSKIQCPIRILSTQVVKPDFSSRALPLYRSYLYRFAVQKKDSGFQSDFSFTHLVPTPIQEYKRCHFVHDSDFDIKAVESVLPLFDGTKDYASFMSNYRIAKLRVEPPPTTVRRLDSVSLHPGRPLIPGYFTDQYFDYWEVKVVGKSFLYKQVRRTVAVLIGVGQGKVNYKDVESLFLNPGTWLDGLKSVPAYGLYLTDVVYSKEALEAPAKGQEYVVKRTVGEEVEGEEEGGEEEEEEEEEEEDRREERRTVKVATSKDTKQLSINEKINLRSSKIKEEQRKAVVRDETRKLSTRHAIALAKSRNLPTMSLLDQLKKQKSKLAHTETVIKTVDGKIVHENFVGNTFTNRLTTSSQPGYIVDNKPDLQIAKITDHLFMGSQDVACDRDLLAVNNVTHVISLGVDVNKFPGIGYTYVDVLDVPEFDIRSVFDEVFEVIDGVICKKGVIDEVFEVIDGVIGKNCVFDEVFEVRDGVIGKNCVFDEVFEVRDGVIGKNGEVFKGKDSIISEKGSEGENGSKDSIICEKGSVDKNGGKDSIISEKGSVGENRSKDSIICEKGNVGKNEDKDSIISEKGSVFVHCNAGVSRSASVVIGYLMKSLRLSFQEAYDMVKAQRNCIKPNEGFVKQLKEYEKEILVENG